MNKSALTAALLLCFLAATPALALPRDAEAVLNRCGQPLRGDETIYENTVAGGHRILHYERGILNFDRVANDGWTFTYGTHGKQDHLNADQMSAFMPCLKDGLADSASPAPLVKVTAMDRAAVSFKRSLREVMLATTGFLLILGIFFILWSKRPVDHEGLVG